MSIPSILKEIKKSNTFLISTHVNPDPDALCCELALFFYLKKLGKKVLIVNDEAVPSRLEFLPGSKRIKSYHRKLRLHYDAAIIVDCGTLDRIGQVVHLVSKDKPLINIDHHITNDHFGSINLVWPKASSTAEILYDVLKAGRCKMNDVMAMHLYAGIMTDTGSFRYENTTSKTHRIAAELKGFRFSAPKLYQKLYEIIPASDIMQVAKVVSNFKSYYNGKVISVKLNRSVLSRFSKDFDLRDTIFRLLRSVTGVEVVAIFTQTKLHQTRINFRSSGKVNVAKLAHSFHGGGHHNASGCMLSKNIELSEKDVLKKLKGLI